MIEVRGAPIDQGRMQGEQLRVPVRAALARLRSSHTALSWLAARRRAQRGPGRALARFVPWQSERLEGIALGARVSSGALEAGESAWRVRGVGAAGASGPCATLDVPPELEPLLVLRASIPDAGGFASLDLTCAHWSGCLAGINSEGIAVICTADRARGQASARWLAQELLFRARDLDAGVEHLRRRARYLGGTGSLLVGAPGVPVRRLLLQDGELLESEAERASAPGRFALEIDCAARRLDWIRTSGENLRGEAPQSAAVRG